MYIHQSVFRDLEIHLAINILAYLHLNIDSCPLLFSGSVDEGVTEGLPTLQSTSSTNAHADEDDRLVLTVCHYLVGCACNF